MMCVSIVFFKNLKNFDFLHSEVISAIQDAFRFNLRCVLEPNIEIRVIIARGIAVIIDADVMPATQCQPIRVAGNGIRGTVALQFESSRINSMWVFQCEQK
jgi:hypothetical protein